MLRDFGVGSYLIQEKQLTQQKIRTAFGITLLMAWCLGLAIFFSRNWVAEFYNEQNLAIIMSWMCINFMIIPFSSPVLALLRREMKFQLLFYINVISSLVAAIVAIYLASSGYSFMSLVWSSIANIFTTTFLTACFSYKIFFMLPSLKNAKEIISYGGKSSLSNIVGELGRNMTDLIIGKYQGFSNVAIYSKAQTVNNIFSKNIVGAIHNVYFPLVSQYNRENQKIDLAFIKATNAITVMAFTFFGFLALYAENIILILFGSQWIESIPLVRILSLGGAIYSIWGLSSKTLYAINKPGVVLKSELIIQSFRMISVISAAFYSLQLVAWAQVATYMLGFVVYISFMKKYISLPILRFIVTSIFHSLSVSLSALAITFYLNQYTNLYFSNSFLSLTMTAIILLLSWVFFIFLFRHPIKNQIFNR